MRLALTGIHSLFRNRSSRSWIPAVPGRAATWLCIGLLLIGASTPMQAGSNPETRERTDPAAAASTAAVQGSTGKAVDKWEFVLAPYLFLAPMDGEVSAAGLTADGEVPAQALLENLEMAGAARFEARKKRWAGLFDFFYMGVGGQGDLPLGRQLDVDIDMLQVEGVLSYRPGPSEMPLEILGGFRYTRQDYKARILGGDPGPGRQFTANWVDPIVGARVKAELRERIVFLLRGDIGGFGAGSEFTWNVETGVGFRLTRRAEIQIKFKALGVDYEEGQGRTFYGYDVITPGVLISFPIHF